MHEASIVSVKLFLTQLFDIYDLLMEELSIKMQNFHSPRCCEIQSFVKHPSGKNTASSF